LIRRTSFPRIPSLASGANLDPLYYVFSADFADSRQRLSAIRPGFALRLPPSPPKAGGRAKKIAAATRLAGAHPEEVSLRPRCVRPGERRPRGREDRDPARSCAALGVFALCRLPDCRRWSAGASASAATTGFRRIERIPKAPSAMKNRPVRRQLMF